MPQRDSTHNGLLSVSLLTLLAFAVAGYHPFVEDGGVYAAGIEKLLNPMLFPAWTAFVTEHLRFSLFAPIVAGFVRLTHLSLEWTLLLLYLLSIWATLLAAWHLVSRLTSEHSERVAAVTLFACWLTLPIAGTSLMLMDPYITARSVTTPLTLLTLTWALDALSGRKYYWLLCASALVMAASLHPLMGGYAFAAVACLIAVRTRKAWPCGLLILSGVAAAAVLQLNAAPESYAYRQIALTRSYWFLSEWHWYEIVGFIAPVIILAVLRKRGTEAIRSLASAAILLGGIAVLVALCFAHELYRTHLVARLQPMRAFQIVYELMILLLGAWLGKHLLKRHVWRWAVLLLAAAGPMFLAQRGTFPHSAYIEWPSAQPQNLWQRAFVWARLNTPTDALFALDAHYITQGREEDAQCFRAIAQRSALPDYSKDGGEAAITLDLADQWATGQAAQTNLEIEPDGLREARLAPLGVTWLVLQASSESALSCPYRNATVKVCRLP